MRVIGLTGGIACGKSTVALALEELGAVIIDGDRIAHSLYVPGGEAIAPIREAFGPGVIAPDGGVDRKALGAAVFGDRDALDRLDGIMQPLILQRIRRALRDAADGQARCCVLDMPLLYEKGLDRLCDTVWCVWLPREEQLQRLMARDGLTMQQAERRLASQLSPDEKAARAQVVIDTRGTIEETAALIPSLWEREMAAQ